MEATVDVAQQTGAPVLGTPTPRASSSTEVFQVQSVEADKRVRAIIAGNLGRPVAAVARAAGHTAVASAAVTLR
jgi:hypothetical protein